MISVLAIDDEPLALRQLSSYIKKIPYLELVGECNSALDAMAVMEKQTVDAIFIDINMPDLNGLDFVKSLSAHGAEGSREGAEVPLPLIVFTTAYSDYAVEGYKVNAVDFLLKPFNLEDMQGAAEKVRAQYELLHQGDVSTVDEDDAIFFKTEHKVVRVQVSDIRYVEGMSEYLKIHLEGDRKPLIVLLSMKKLEEHLPRHVFMRIHRSYIINLRKIQEVNKNRVILDADTYLPIGDLYRDTFNKYLDSKFLGK